MTRILTVLFVTLLLVAGSAQAHEVRPGYLEVNETAPGRYDVFWKVPARGAATLALNARLPDNCRQQADPIVINDGAASIKRWVSLCEGGLKGQTITIDGLQTTFTDVLARVVSADRSVQTARLTPTSFAFEVKGASSFLDVSGTYFRLGVEHILMGIDHLLFVLVLLLLVNNIRMILLTVTAFTVSHSISLAAASLGLLNIPVQPVEAVIALSIVLVAAEIARKRQLGQTEDRRRPWLIAFVFGFLHGLGFASALAGTGLPQQAIGTALLFFNIGVEAGQLLFIAAVLASWQLVRLMVQNVPSWWWRVPIYSTGIVAAFWTVERMAAFL
jgi:hydrogenase/urease accessory protein HupE